jgi:hypothetical protein
MVRAGARHCGLVKREVDFMHSVRWGRLLIGAVAFVVLGQQGWAQQGTGAQSCRDVLSGSAPSARQSDYCAKRAADARSDLQARGIDPSRLSDIDAIERSDREYDTARAAQGLIGIDTQTPNEKRADLRSWGVDVRGLSDAQVRDRWGRESAARSFAEMQAARRTQEAQTLRQLANEDAADARRRQIDEVGRQATQSAEGMRRAADLARAQGDAALRSLGVDPDALKSEDEDTADAEAAAFELRTYQQMVDNGLAPQCKGKTGDDLIECVDAALGGNDK